LVDIVSKNGNLLLDVGPQADGTIPAVQMERLVALGDWMRVNGQAIYGTHPWKRAEGTTAEGVAVRFTRKGSDVYAILLGDVKGNAVTIKDFSAAPGSKVYLLGDEKPLKWSQQESGLKISLPVERSGKYGYALRFDGPIS
jgi:alpha-L-fucosidase